MRSDQLGPYPELPELTDEERAAIDAVDMSAVLGTPEERIRFLTDRAVKYWRECHQLRAKLTSFNTSWQHDPPQVGDTRWVRVRYTGPAQPRFDKFTDEEPVE